MPQLKKWETYSVTETNIPDVYDTDLIGIAVGVHYRFDTKNQHLIWSYNLITGSINRLKSDTLSTSVNELYTSGQVTFNFDGSFYYGGYSYRSSLYVYKYDYINSVKTSMFYVTNSGGSSGETNASVLACDDYIMASSYTTNGKESWLQVYNKTTTNISYQGNYSGKSTSNIYYLKGIYDGNAFYYNSLNTRFQLNKTALSLIGNGEYQPSWQIDNVCYYFSITDSKLTIYSYNFKTGENLLEYQADNVSLMPSIWGGDDSNLWIRTSAGNILHMSINSYSISYTIANSKGTDEYLTISDQFPITGVKVTTSGNTKAFTFTWLDGSTSSYNYSSEAPSGYQLKGYSLTKGSSKVDIPLNSDITISIDSDSTFYEVYGKYQPIVGGITTTLYQNSAEEKVVDKTSSLKQVGTLEGVLRAESSIVNPIIVFEYSKLPDFNYVYIAEFGRYYYVTDITSVNMYLWRITMKVDPLMTYKDTIVTLAGHVARNENVYNLLIDDDLRNFYRVPLWTKIASLEESPFDVTTYNSRRYILSCFTESKLITTSATSYNSQFNSNAKYICTPTEIAEISKELVNPSMWSTLEHLFASDPAQSIISIKCYPFNIPDLLYANIDVQNRTTIEIGTYQTSITAVIYSASPQKPYFRAGIFDLTTYGKNWYEYGAKINIWLPFIGFTSIDPNLALGKYIHIYYIISPDEGTAQVNIYASDSNAEINPYDETGYALIITTQGTIAVNIPITQSNAIDQTRNAINAGISGALALYSGNSEMLIRAAQGLAESSITSFTSKGAVGGAYAGAFSPLECFIQVVMKTPTMSEAADLATYRGLYGMPLDEVKSLDEVGGFTKLQGIHVTDLGTATDPEIREVETYLNTGVILPEYTPPTTSYTITYNLSDCYVSGASSISEGGTVTATFTADSGYTLPASIFISGATGSWTQSTGSLVISNPKSDVTVRVQAVEDTTYISYGYYLFNDVLTTPTETLEASFSFMSGKNLSYTFSGTTARTLSGDTYATVTYGTEYAYSQENYDDYGTPWVSDDYKLIYLNDNGDVANSYMTWFNANATRVYKLNYEITNGTAVKSADYIPASGGTITVTPSSGYKVGTVSCTGATATTSGNVITISDVTATADVIVKITCIQVVYYTVTAIITNGECEAMSSWEISEDDTLEFTIYPSDGYKYPTTINVTYAEYTYDSTTGKITISNPTGNPVITAECEAKLTNYDITVSVDNMGYTGDTQCPSDGTASVNLTITNENYYYPETVTVTGAELVSYDNTNGAIIIQNATGAVTITGESRVNTLYGVTFTITNGSATYEGTELLIRKYGSGTATITADSGYSIPTSLTATPEGACTLEYDSSTGIVNISEPRNEITVTGECIEETE